MSGSAKKTSTFQNGLIWFGAGVSIAEILTGTYFAPLGFGAGIAAIFAGHLIGCTMFFLAGLIGAKTGLSAMQTVGLSFGGTGRLFFAALNVLQLVGWTAIMIYDCALAANNVLGIGAWVWCLVTCALILLWISVGIRNLNWINKISMAALFVLSLILFVLIFRNVSDIHKAAGDMTFGAAVELAVAMPLSWLPLISDYTREAEHPTAAAAVSTLTYGAVSCWMYIIGLGAALFTGGSDIAMIMVRSGLGVGALVILILSTVTTTFLDAWSAGISAEAIHPKINGKKAALAVAVIGGVCAVFFPMDDITGFLYMIGSVFAPMIAVQITDFYILGRRSADKGFDITGFAVWLAGFVIYRLIMTINTPVGCTLPDMLLTVLLCLAARRLVSAFRRRA
jgi:putative hydroxymethylpyrimidine transporter CytX